MSFINYVYTNDNFQIVNTTYNTSLDNDYSILYNKIPLKSSDQSDETYTYLAATKQDSASDARIVGLKDNSEYVNLTNAGGKKINDLLNDENTIADINKGFYPIIVNAYAQHKYHLSVGDNIQFVINNKTDRITKQINEDDSKDLETFKVVGINTTYQGEEYFTNQELANSILGLRSKFENLTDKFAKSCKLHNYYFNSQKADALVDGK
jgi:hypothetical protein